MARPKKRTVEYFPHDTNASHGKTCTIIYSKFGNDGLIFWWLLLELLGRTPGHFFDFNDEADLEYLCAETHQNDTKTTINVLNLLSVLGAIDKTLFKSRVIWSDNFVKRIADAYSRTKDNVPKKPVNVSKTNVSVDILHTETPEIVTKTPQKEKEIEIYKDIKKEDKERKYELPDWLDKQTWQDFKEMRQRMRKPITDRARELLIKKLETFRAVGEDPTKIMEQSILNSWQDFYAIKNKGVKDGTHRRDFKENGSDHPLRDSLSRPLGGKF